MGYGIMAYRVSLSSIESHFGTEDAGLKAKIIASCESYFDRLDGDFETEDGWPEAKSVMEDYLNGTLGRVDYNSAKHWYVLELLIRGFGQDLNNGHWYPANIDPLYSFSEFRMYLLGKEGKLKLNGPDDFPVVFTVENQNLDAALESIKANFSDAGQVGEFASWVQDAKAHEQDLVMYYY